MTTSPPKRTNSPWKKRLLVSLSILGTGAALYSATRPKKLEVEVDTIRRGPLIVAIQEEGIARVTDRYIVSAPLNGNVARSELHAGDTVKQGDVLARILPMRAPLLDARSKGEAEARVQAASASAAQAKALIERARIARELSASEAKKLTQLAGSGAVSKQDLERGLADDRAKAAELTSAEFAAKIANHDLTMARAALGRLGTAGDDGDQFTVTSPISGRVLRVIQQSEGVVQPGTKLLELGDPSALEVAVDVLTSDAVQIQPQARVTLDEWGGAPLAARVRLIEPSAFTRLSALGVEEQRVNAIVNLTGPYEEFRALGDGYHVSAKIEIYRNDDALLVPFSALFRHKGGWAVFVVDGEVAALRTVELGRRNELAAEVLRGLSQGDVVVVHPSEKVRAGSIVESGATLRP